MIWVTTACTYCMYSPRRQLNWLWNGLFLSKLPQKLADNLGIQGEGRGEGLRLLRCSAYLLPSPPAGCFHRGNWAIAAGCLTGIWQGEKHLELGKTVIPSPVNWTGIFPKDRWRRLQSKQYPLEAHMNTGHFVFAFHSSYISSLLL